MTCFLPGSPTVPNNRQAGKLCATPFGVDIVGITEFIALVGALVGGVTARQRKEELERLNEQLRKINLSLRQQARAGTVYAPGVRVIVVEDLHRTCMRKRQCIWT